MAVRSLWIVYMASTLAFALGISIPQAAHASCVKSRFKVVLDVGHTKEEKGATSARGIPEYSFNLTLAQTIKTKLMDAGYEQTDLLITQGGGRAALLSRAAYANRQGANLLLSVHHDSVQPSYLQKWQVEGKPQRFSDKFEGYSLFVSNKNRSKIASLNFAILLSDQLLAHGLKCTKHHAEDIAGERREFLDEQRGIYRYDNLAVLRGTIAPAVLLEAGVIVNRSEETVAASVERMQTIGDAVTLAVTEFCVSGKEMPIPTDEGPLPH